MNQFDERIDAYIQRSANFSKPVLTHLRNLIHVAFPEIKETIKWSMPYFDYKGTVCFMAAFKQHCTFGFWKGGLITDKENLLEKKDEAMGHFGRITSLADLPSDGIIISYIQEAIKLNEQNAKIRKPKVIPKAEIPMPDYFAVALSNNNNALESFKRFTPSQKREYLEWITEAKTEATRDKRLETAMEWIKEGKTRMWKYKK